MEEGSLSNYWRTTPKSSVPMELVELLRSMRLLGKVLNEQEEMTFAWMVDGKVPNNTVPLNPAPLQGLMAPFDGQMVDVVVGEGMNDIGWELLDSADATNTRMFNTGNREFLDTIAKILEDGYVYREMSALNPVNGDYIDEARAFYAPTQKYVDHAAKFLDNIDNPVDERSKALCDVMRSILNHGMVPTPGTLRKTWLQYLVKFCGQIPTAVTGTAVKRREKFIGFYKALSRIFELEKDNDDYPEPGAQGPSEGNTGKQGVWESMPGSISQEKTSDKSVAKQGKMKQQIDQAEKIDAAGAEDLGQEMKQAMGAGGVDNDTYLIVDAATGKPDDMKHVQKERDRLARLLEMYRELRWRRIRGEHSGKISQRRLWRAGIPQSNTVETPRLFDRKVKLDDTGLAVCLVLDQSGSIGDEWQKILIPIAAGLTTGVHKDVDIWACSYTNGRSHNGLYGTIVSVLYRPEWKTLRTGVGEQGGTPSAVGLVAAETFLKKSRKTNKLVIHVTDGMPGGVARLSGGESCHRALQYLNDRNIKVATLFVTGGYDIRGEGNSSATYAFGEHLGYVKNFNDVPGEVEKILMSTVKEITHKSTSI